jgi:DNA-binding response OmpR family regulator
MAQSTPYNPLPPGARTVLIVDDDPLICQTLASYLADTGWKVLTAGNGNEALALMNTKDVHVVVTDILMPDRDGI